MRLLVYMYVCSARKKGVLNLRIPEGQGAPEIRWPVEKKKYRTSNYEVKRPRAVDDLFKVFALSFTKFNIVGILVL